VLEHFTNDEISFSVLRRFWEKTRGILIVHVPQEETPNPAWGHYITFNREKLTEWGVNLGGGNMLGDNYRFSPYTRYSDAGFLILKKETFYEK
jgi:hypothetical protein